MGEDALVGTGQLPKFEHDLFRISDGFSINGGGAYLIPTGAAGYGLGSETHMVRLSDSTVGRFFFCGLSR